jgi:DNA-directed RNA polymerase subunit K/omega
LVDEDEDDAVDVAFDAEEDEFFDEKNFKEFNERIKFRAYDPEDYETELHKELVIVPKNYRKTSEVITKFEYTDVVSNRAKQIENGSRIFADVGDEDSPIKMAEMEIRQKQCPLSVRRMISNNIAEIWDVNEMIIPY